MSLFDPFGKFTKRFLIFGGGRSLLPYTLDPSTSPDGALPAPWQGATWSVSSGKIINTPTGSELLTNGGMELPYNTTGTLSIADSWVNSGMDDGVDTASRETTIIHGGLSSQKFVVDAANEGIAYGSDFTVTVNKWQTISLYARSGVLNQQIAVGQFYGRWPVLFGSFKYLSDIAWKNLYRACRPSATGAERVIARSSAFGAITAYIDDVSVLDAAQNTLFSVMETGNTHVTVRAGLTLKNIDEVEAPHGVVVNLDSTTNPQNFVVAYLDNASGILTNIVLEKCVGGTYTTLQTVAVTYSGGRLLELRRLAGTNTYQIWYHGSQIGVDETVADAGIIGNTKHGLFGTGGGNTVDSFFAGKAV